MIYFRKDEIWLFSEFYDASSLCLITVTAPIFYLSNQAKECLDFLLFAPKLKQLKSLALGQQKALPRFRDRASLCQLFSVCSSAGADQWCLWPSARRSGQQTSADSGATGREIHPS